MIIRPACDPGHKHSGLCTHIVPRETKAVWFVIHPQEGGRLGKRWKPTHLAGCATSLLKKKLSTHVPGTAAVFALVEYCSKQQVARHK